MGQQTSCLQGLDHLFLIVCAVSALPCIAKTFQVCPVSHVRCSAIILVRNSAIIVGGVTYLAAFVGSAPVYVHWGIGYVHTRKWDDPLPGICLVCLLLHSAWFGPLKLKESDMIHALVLSYFWLTLPYLIICIWCSVSCYEVFKQQWVYEDIVVSVEWPTCTICKNLSQLPRYLDWCLDLARVTFSHPCTVATGITFCIALRFDWNIQRKSYS